jgi:phytoene synthase
MKAKRIDQAKFPDRVNRGGQEDPAMALSVSERPIEKLNDYGQQLHNAIWRQDEDRTLAAREEDQILQDAYNQCERITKEFSKTFYKGTKLMTEEQKKAVWAIYTWCRRTDDLVDGPQAMASSPEKMDKDLKEWRSMLNKAWGGEPHDVLDLTLVETKRKYPSLPLKPFLDMIDGMAMDTPQLGQDRYETWDDLYLYCYRVASTVGLMTLPIFGTAKGYTEAEAAKPAEYLGIALQITNILRDVGEDARQRNRIYLPLKDMERFRVTEAQILNGVSDENYIELMKFEIQRARDYYKKAEEGIPMLAPDARLAVQSASSMYSKILDKIEANGYDNFRKRAYTTKVDKLVALLEAWWTVSKMP